MTKSLYCSVATIVFCMTTLNQPIKAQQESSIVPYAAAAATCYATYKYIWYAKTKYKNYTNDDAIKLLRKKKDCPVYKGNLILSTKCNECSKYKTDLLDEEVTLRANMSFFDFLVHLPTIIWQLLPSNLGPIFAEHKCLDEKKIIYRDIKLIGF